MSMKYFMELSSSVGKVDTAENGYKDVITFVEYSPADGYFMEFKDIIGKKSFGRYWFQQSEIEILFNMFRDCVQYGSRDE